MIILKVVRVPDANRLRVPQCCIRISQGLGSAVWCSSVVGLSE